jgi:hypothetical protein
MTSDKQPNDAVFTAYKDAPARTITAGGVTYADRELGPKGGVAIGEPVIIYPDSGHGGIFQIHDEFVPVAVESLPADRPAMQPRTRDQKRLDMP